MADNWKPVSVTPLSPTERAKALGASTENWTPTSMSPYRETPEQRYEGLVNKSGKAKGFLPGTLGEVGYAAGTVPSLLKAMSTLGVEAAPETEGGSLLLSAPLLLSMLGGALENPKSLSDTLHNIGKEGLKSTITELAGRIPAKAVEVATGFGAKNAMYDASSKRVGESIPKLFNNPWDDLFKLRSINELQEQLGGGKTAIEAGNRLGEFRSSMATKFGPYKLEVKPKLIDASSEGPAHYTTGSPGTGRSVVIPTEDGSEKRMSIPDAMDEVRTMFAGGRSATGVQKSSAASPELLDRAVKARDRLAKTMDAMFPGENLGQQYRGHERNYATAKQLQKVFTAPARNTNIRGGTRAVIDQPKVKAAAERVQAKLNQISPDAGTTLSNAVSPRGTTAVHEEPYGPHIKGSTGGIHTFFKPPTPYRPESRQQMPTLGRFFSDPRLSKAYGYILQRLAEAGD